MTSLPARRLGLRDRGVIGEGMAADLLLFDPDEIADTATYDDPIRYPKGIEMVVVNGKVTVEAGEHLGTRAGKALRFSGRAR
jgi:N-acyl-D-aspartate/D-glutamate deacylase